MRWLIKGSCSVWALMLLFVATPLVSAQDVKPSDNKAEAPLGAMQLGDVRLKGDVASVLAQLALQYDIPIGFEWAMNADDFSERRMRFTSITLADLLDQLVVEQKQYSWEIRDGVVYVFPKEGYRDPIVERLLNIEIKTFSLKKMTLTFDVEAALLKKPEFKEVVDDYGLSTRNGYILSGFYFPQLGRNYTLDVSDTTVRAILNRIVKDSPTAKFWSISRDSRSHTLGIDLAANVEDRPKNFRPRIDFEELERLSYPIP